MAPQTVEPLASGSSEHCTRPSRGAPRRLPWGYGGAGGRGRCSPHSTENREEPAISSQVPQGQWFAQSTSGIRRACAVHARCRQGRPEPKCSRRKWRAVRALRDPHGTAPGPAPECFHSAPIPPGLLQCTPSISSSGRRACLATGGAEEAQLHKPNRLRQPGRLTGDSPDTRRTLPVDNIWARGSTSSLRRAS